MASCSLRGIAVVALIGLGLEVHAKSHGAGEALDPSKAVKLTSRIPCDGSTNPQEEVTLSSTFSQGGWVRSFRLDIFDQKYCKTLDLGFACLMPGHDKWRQEWLRSSTAPPATDRLGLNSCYEWGSKQIAQYVLTGWYKDGGPESKLPWKQAVIKQISSKPEVYEFADPNGGTARLEVKRP